MNSIIRRFDRAPLEDRLLRANPAQPPKSGKATLRPSAPPAAAAEFPRRTTTGASSSAASNGNGTSNGPARKPINARPARNTQGGRQSAFAEELAKAL